MVLNLERLEHRLYKDYPYTCKILKVNSHIVIMYTCNFTAGIKLNFLKHNVQIDIDLNIINKHRTELGLVLDDYCVLPELVVHDLDDHLYLVNGQAQDEIDKFLSTEHTIDEYKKYVVNYHKIALNIPVIVNPEIVVGIFEVRRSDIIKTLCKQAEKLKNMIISRMTNTYLAIGKK